MTEKREIEIDINDWSHTNSVKNYINRWGKDNDFKNILVIFRRDAR